MNHLFRLHFTRGSGHQIFWIIGFLLMGLQFMFFGVYASVELFKEAYRARDDQRSRIAAGLLLYLLEHDTASEDEVRQKLIQAGVERGQVDSTLHFLKEKTVLYQIPEGLAITPPIRKLFPS